MTVGGGVEVKEKCRIYMTGRNEGDSNLKAKPDSSLSFYIRILIQPPPPLWTKPGHQQLNPR